MPDDVTEQEKRDWFEAALKLGSDKWLQVRDWVQGEVDTHETPPEPSERFVRSRGAFWQCYDQSMPCPQLVSDQRPRLNPKSGAFEMPKAPPPDRWVRVKLVYEHYVCISKAQSDQDSMRGFADIIADAIRGKAIGAASPPANINERVITTSEIASVGYEGVTYLPNAAGHFLLPSSYLRTVATFQTAPTYNLGPSGRTRVEYIEEEAKAA